MNIQQQGPVAKRRRFRPEAANLRPALQRPTRQRRHHGGRRGKVPE